MPRKSPILLQSCGARRQEPTQLQSCGARRQEPTQLQSCGARKETTNLGSCSGGGHHDDHKDSTNLGSCSGGGHHDDDHKDPTALHCGSCPGDHADDHPTQLKHEHMHWRTFADLSAFTPAARGAVFINTLDQKYAPCDVTSFAGDPYETIHSAPEVPVDHCYLYCAHSKCGSAKRFANMHWDKLAASCGSISYLKPGALGMLGHPDFEVENHNQCAALLN